MALRVIWQYMDRSVPPKLLYGPQKLRSIYYLFGDGPVHILPYDPQCHELFAIYPYISECIVFMVSFLAVHPYIRNTGCVNIN